MTTNLQKTALLTLFDQTRSVIQEFVSSRRESDQHETGTLRQPSAKDVLANCAFWMVYMVERMAYYRRGELPPRHVDFAALDRQTFETHQDSSWEEIITYVENALNGLIAEVTSFSEQELHVNNVYGDADEGGPLWGEIRANGFIHPLQEIEKFYHRKGEIAAATTIHTLLRDVIGESEKIVVNLINPHDLRQQQVAGSAPLVIDVRDAKEFAAGHVEGAINIPFDLLTNHLEKLSPDQPIVTYCNMHHPGQSRGERAALLLHEKGYQASALDGGFPGWQAATK